jgi:hypothetical protein
VVKAPGSQRRCIVLPMRYELIHIHFVEESRPPLWPSGQSSWLHNEDVLCLLLSTNSIYICYVEESRLPLWSSGQSSWLQNGDVLCFMWGTNWIYICYVEESRPPLLSTGHNSWLQSQRSHVRFPALPDFLRSSVSGTESTLLYPQNVKITSPTSRGRSVGVLRLWTQATEY